MIDPQTGAVQFDQPAVAITRDLTQEQFLAGPLGAIASPLNQNAPWARFAYKGVTSGGETWAGDLCFQGDRLYSVSLAVNRREFGSSWDDWSEQKELARKAFHDEWLTTFFGRPAEEYRFAWGTVSSTYDAKGGGSALHVVYK